MTATELLHHCKTFQEEHSLLVLLDVLETIFESHEQSACVELLEDDEFDDLDEMEVICFTAH